MDETSYGAFLGEVNQAVAVDSVEATNVFEQLFTDPALRARMGAAGRARILEKYTWPRVIQEYEAIWQEQEIVRQGHAAMTGVSGVRTPVPFPEIEYSFASYPSVLLGMTARVVAAEDAPTRIDILLRLPITNYLARTRIVDPAVVLSIVEAAKEPCELAMLDALLSDKVPIAQPRRATLAWMLKYDLLRVVSERMD
jgi:hypothetical protein